MGARIDVTGNVALINGVDKLIGSEVKAHDIRTGAALLLAALSAEGESIILEAHQIDRGYEKLDEKLRKLGAHIKTK
jgi:UDP-N-acetylglucosamine 1-carboxyvinyltransferase